MINPRFVANAWISTLVFVAAVAAGHGGAIVAALVIALTIYILGIFA